MGSELSRTLDQLRQPEYTGENRCIPCTVVNLVIAVVLAGLVGIAAPPAALLVFVLSVAAIYFRGYLVPGTPTLTKRYFPDWLLAKFDKAPAPGEATGPVLEQPDAAATESDERDEAAAAPDAAEAADAGTAAASETAETADAGTAAASETAETADAAATDAQADAADEESPLEDAEPEQVFLDHEILVPCGESSVPEHADKPEDDLCLTASIREDWRDEIADRRDGDRLEQLTTFLDVDPELISIQDDEYVRVLVDGRTAGRWESDAALVADIAAERVLGDYLPDWEPLSLRQRSQFANGLRAFIERCPSCDGEISLNERTVESCCRSHQVYAITCNECEERIIEVTDH